MATVTIRNLDDAVAERLKARAKMNDRSLESELRFLLTQAASGVDPQEFAAAAARIRRLTPPPALPLPPLRSPLPPPAGTAAQQREKRGR